MRSIALQMYVSLDGVMEAPEKWTFEYWDGEHERYAYEWLVASALLLGRFTDNGRHGRGGAWALIRRRRGKHDR
jgi:hypothetical protein